MGSPCHVLFTAGSDRTADILDRQLHAMNGSRDPHLITSSASASTDDETSKPSRLRGLEIDSEIKLGRLLHRDIAGLRPAKNLIDQFGGPPEHIWDVWSQGHETTALEMNAIIDH
jgi:hypothetical protein